MSYISVLLTKESNNALKEFQNTYNIPNPLDKSKFHVTLFSDAETKFDENVILSDINKRLSGKLLMPTGFIEFTGSDGKKVIGLKLVSFDLMEEHNKIRSLGYKHIYGNYVSHITLSYDGLTNKTATNFPILQISKCKIEQFVSSWQNKIKII